MARKRRNDTFDDVFEIMQSVFTVVPPWLCIPAAAIAYAVIVLWFRHKMTIPQFQVLGHAIGGLFALACLTGGISGFRIRRQRAAFLRQNITLDWVNSLTWQEFEKLAGEIFRRRGYSVEHVGGGGADDGIDLRLSKDGTAVLVQCKRWKVFKVGVRPIREFYGVMMSEGVHRGILVSSGVYTKQALRFAEGKSLELIDGAQLAEMAKAIQGRALDSKSPIEQSEPDSVPERPSCPSCGAEMLLRRAKNGKNAGQEFWGCSTFPRCRGTRLDLSRLPL